jgi:Rps23 Pro-64 3,4-dihydroxylase Tpa1-like proline 4-hydroxylase
MIIARTTVVVRTAPFAHAVTPRLLDDQTAAMLLDWFEDGAPWRHKLASFYEQYECNLHEAQLPAGIARLTGPAFVAELARHMLAPISEDQLELTEVNAHKLVGGQTIKIHNDYIEGAETHRVLVQLNRGWNDANGGMLMLFSGPDAEDLARVIRPTHTSATSFEISPTSFHAVSTIHEGERYTLVYSFRRSRPVLG